jgi:phosphatidylglycerol:prolipoprotein diacylglycerol transferase
VQPDIHVFGVDLKTFGLCFAAGFIAAGLVIQRRCRELGQPSDTAYEIVLGSLIGGLVGSRVYYLIQHWSTVKHDLVGAAFSGSGLVWYGGLIGGAIGVLIAAKRRNFLSLTMLDACSLPLALGYAIGRIGCQVSGDGDYGKVSDLPWAMGYPHGAVPTPPGVTVQPTPIYETLATGLYVYALWRMRDRFRPGVLFALYLVFAGLERLLVEFVRRNAEVVAGLTAPQLESIGLVLAGLIWIAVAARRGPLGAPGPPARLAS